MSFLSRWAICPLKIAYKRYKRPINTQRIITSVSGANRPSDKGGGGGGAVNQTPRKGGGPVSKKRFFGPFGPQLGLKLGGGPGPPGPSPRSATDGISMIGVINIDTLLVRFCR